LVDANALKCARGKAPIVRMALKQEKCIRVPGVKISNAEEVVAYVQREYGCAP
jgi:hypothetical protein